MNEIIEMKNSNPALWECNDTVQEIKDIFCKNLSSTEFKMFMNIGKATGLNPFLREIWAVKYGDAPASMFIARDGYRKSAQSDPNYDYHIVDAVYSNDEYQLVNGEVVHKYNLSGRGNLIGAYCSTKRKTSSKPHTVFVSFKEYNTGKAEWAKKPETMIKKVAESQCLRMAFQALFSNTYHESEQYHVEQSHHGVTLAEVANKQLGISIQPSGIDYRGIFNYCQTKDDLKQKFDAIKKTAKSQEELQQIVTEKDKRKAELEAIDVVVVKEVGSNAQTNDEWLKEFDGNSAEDETVVNKN